MAKNVESRFCSKCGKTMKTTEFYQSNNLDKYPDKFLNQCKKCITMHVDNWNPDSYLWILQECDVPYIPEEWYKLLSSYAKDRTKVTGTTILGRYLSKMKLNQWNKFRWKDSEFLQKLANSKMEEAMKRQGFDVQQITEAVNKASFDIPTEELKIPDEVLEVGSYRDVAEALQNLPASPPNNMGEFMTSVIQQPEENDDSEPSKATNDKIAEEK